MSLFILPRFVALLSVVVFMPLAATYEVAAEHSTLADTDQKAADLLQNKYGHWARYVAQGNRTALTKCWGQTGSPIDPSRCVLLVVHMEKETMERNTMMDAVALYNSQLRDQYFARIENVVVPNLDKLIGFFHRKKMPVIYTSLAREGPHPRFSKHVGDNDAIIAGTTANVFYETKLDTLLKKKQIETIFLTGLGTSHCVTFSAYGAMSRGYQVIVIPDATADPRPDHYEAILKVLGLHAFLKSADDVISDYPWQEWVESTSLPPLADN